MFSRKGREQKAVKKQRGAVRKTAARQAPVIRLRHLLLMMLMGIMVAAAWQIRNSVSSDVMAFEHVNIKGDFVYLSPESVADIVKQRLDGDYFTLNLDHMRDALLEHPWIEEVSVRRRWPSGLDITVTERSMIAYWGEDSLLSDRGDVFTPSQLPEAVPMPRLTGPQGLHDQVWQFYVDISSRMASFDLAINELVLDGRRSWKLVLGDGTRIELGRSHIQDRMKRLQQVLALGDAIVLDKIEQIDMRYPNGFAVLYSQQGAGLTETITNMDGNSVARISEV